MRRIIRPLCSPTPIMVLLVVLIGGGAAIASIPAASGVISGCYQKRAGVLRIIDTAKHGSAGKCRRSEKRLTWSQQGPRGPQGLPGNQGIQGNPGPLLTQLPSGRTETGTYAVIAAVGVNIGFTSISFPIALAADPTANLIKLGDPATAACPGSASAPAAAAGQLCLYEGFENNRSALTLSNPENDAPGAASKFGAALDIQPDGGAGNALSTGTWAVTAR